MRSGYYKHHRFFTALLKLRRSKVNYTNMSKVHSRYLNELSNKNVSSLQTIFVQITTEQFVNNHSSMTSCHVDIPEIPASTNI